MKEQHAFEYAAWKNNRMVCGIDEAGRGPLAGPVVVAAAVLPPGTQQSFLQDSKKLTARVREQAFAWITQHAFYTVVVVDHYRIEQDNIYQATKKAMLQAYIQMVEMLSTTEQLQYVLVDAMPLEIPALWKHQELEVASFPFAESRSMSVAAASIVAKVIRDQLMCKLGEQFPTYQFMKHKGYGTVVHTKALASAGPSIIHRQSYIKNILKRIKHEYEKQQSLC